MANRGWARATPHRTLFKKLLLRWAQLVVVTRKHGGAILLHLREQTRVRVAKTHNNAAPRRAIAERQSPKCFLCGRALGDGLPPPGG